MNGRGPLRYDPDLRRILERKGTGKGFMLSAMSKADMDEWNRRLMARPKPTVLVWFDRGVWMRSYGRNGRWVLEYSHTPPRPGERRIKL